MLRFPGTDEGMDDAAKIDKPIDLTVSIATWNNRDLVAGCLASVIESAGDLSDEVIVVDNASTDGTSEMIAERFPGVLLIQNERPMGFSANHNQVLRRANGRFVLLLNDDTIVVEDALLRAVRFLEAEKDAGAVGCTLVKPDGTPERVSQRFPHPLDPLLPSLRDKVPANEQAATVDSAGAVEVDRLSGACLMVRREVTEQIGALDVQFNPCYGEDTDFCLRIKRAGWKIFRLTGARVIHHRGQTAKREFADQARRLQEAKYRWYRKHRSRASLLVYRAAVTLASVWGLVRCVPVLLSPSRRETARAKIKRLSARLAASSNPRRWEARS